MDGVRSEITRASAAGGRLEQTLHQRPWKEAALPTPGSRLPVSRSMGPCGAAAASLAGVQSSRIWLSWPHLQLPHPGLICCFLG